jgi:hypothetical protein
LDELRSANTSSADAAEAVGMLAGTLCTNLQAARGHSGIGQIFADAVNRCCDILDSVARESQPIWLSRAPAVEEAHEQRYTMQAERDVHQAEIGALASPTPDAADSGYADDVEFF